eukprot:13659431-Alexandrium_andersonii.AAC.1
MLASSSVANGEGRPPLTGLAGKRARAPYTARASAVTSPDEPTVHERSSRSGPCRETARPVAGA